MDSQDRINFKLGAKSQILDHLGFYILLSILWLALSWIGGMVYERSVNVFTQTVTTNGGTFMGSVFSFGWLLIIAGQMLRAGTRLTMIDIDRGNAQLDNPIQRSFKLFDNGRYFLGWLFIGILIAIFTFLWSLLLVVPGIIKAYSYSQAFFLYRDAVDKGESMTVLQAITKSRQLMDGNKAFLFIMDLSFIGWFLLSFITFGVANLFVQPYYDMARAKFFTQLVVRHDQPQMASAGTSGQDSSDSE
ncbi:DUF975 family protein [Levilactobacillus tujiorum]|uniref:DUF975 family protein n=1 Tax=Levilactobacillus tujiorum TaxID=2912243 RepID=UPI001456F188|nr:DUF975 family protein [Levilactobacillus tujiorum]NLR32412.1 DUF975 family protein [Levilactobacillus tujiorum]